jgi:type VI secretion system protein ImpH
MAATGRTQGADLSAEAAYSEIAELVAREPFLFDFFQAVRLLERMAPDRKPVGRFIKPGNEVARFGVHPSLNFPASQIQSIRVEPGRPPFLEVNFMGLTGPLGVLPTPYTELMRERMRHKDTALRDFFDVFHHRIISLFYQAWEKYRFQIAYERGDRDRFSHHLLDLIGLGTPGLQSRQDVPDDSLLYYCGLLGLNTRSAVSLQQLLGDYFEVPVAVQQFVGAWYPIDAGVQCRIGEETGPSEQLGRGAVVGDEIWDQQSRIRIRLGPLTFEQYRDFLPGNSGWRGLRALTLFFTRGEVDAEVQLVLKREEVPGCELADQAAASAQLGWSTWVKSAAMNRDPDETILLLDGEERS